MAGPRGPQGPRGLQHVGSSKRGGVCVLICLPCLFAVFAVFAVQAVLMAGRNRAAKHGMLTQKGKPKAMGSKSWLATCGKLTPVQRVQLQMAFKARARGDFGWRTLRDKINKVLKIKLKSHEAARRFCNEFNLYYKA